MKLSFKLSAQAKGVQKAYSRFVKQYGTSEGERIFTAYADEHGKGNTLREKCNSVYKKGARVGK